MFCIKQIFIIINWSLFCKENKLVFVFDVPPPTQPPLLCFRLADAHPNFCLTDNSPKLRLTYAHLRLSYVHQWSLSLDGHQLSGVWEKIQSKES